MDKGVESSSPRAEEAANEKDEVMVVEIPEDEDEEAGASVPPQEEEEAGEGGDDDQNAAGGEEAEDMETDEEEQQGAGGPDGDARRAEEEALDAELMEKVGFAKLMGTEGSTIEYTIKKYEIFIGRKSKSTPVDVVLGNSMSISRKHAKISYNFEEKIWQLTVLGKNGVSVGKILYAPSSGPVGLKSQELLQFGDKLEPVSLYFLLPLKE
jgi:hypothetical protein